MALSPFRRWINSFRTNRCQCQTAAPRSRPQLETLEDRLAPAVQTITVLPPAAPVPEGDGTAKAPSGVMVFTVNRSGTASDIAAPLTLNYRTVDGTAKAGIDYKGVTEGQVQFNAGSTSTTVSVQLIGNTIWQPNRTLSIQVFNPIQIPAAVSASFGVDVNSPPPGYPNQTVNTSNGNTPRWISFGDLNGDGKKDMVTVNLNSPDIEVLMNTTPPGQTVPTYDTYVSDTDQPKDSNGKEINPQRAQVALFDLFGNGKLDLVTADNKNDEVTVFTNTTAKGAAVPTFTLAHYNLKSGDGPLFLAIADFNGDGRPDIAVSNHGTANVSILLQNADGTFAPEVTVSPSSTTPIPAFLVAKDLNGDGKPDLVVGSWNTANGATPAGTTVTALINTFTTGGTTATFNATVLTAGDNPLAVTVADVNGDGKPDIVAANSGLSGVAPVWPADDTMSVWVNTTPIGAAFATFAPRWDFGTGVSGYGKFIDQAFDPKTNSFFNPNGAFNSFTRSIDVNDLNGDGRPDITLALRDQDRVSILLNETPKGSLTPNFFLQQLLFPGNSPRANAWGDATGNGVLDLAVTSTGNPTSSSNPYSERVGIFLNATIPIQFVSQAATGTILDDDAPVSMTIQGATSLSTVVNTAFSPEPVVLLTNKYGDPVQGAIVTFIAPRQAVSGEFGGVFQTTAVSDANGLATPSNLIASTRAGNWLLTAVGARSSFGTAVSLANQSFAMTNIPDVPAQLAFLTQPTLSAFNVILNTIPAKPTPPGIKVELLDQFGNPVTSGPNDAQVVSINLLDSTGTGVNNLLTSVSNTFSVTTTAGVAVFPDLAVTQPGNRYRLEADSAFNGTPLTGLSNPFNVAGPAVRLVLRVPPTLIIHKPYQITLTALDAFGNVAAVVPGTVSLKVVSPGSFSLVPSGGSGAGAVLTYTLTSHTVGRGVLRISAVLNGQPFTLDTPFYTVFGSLYPH
jgi:hypothetical protein